MSLSDQLCCASCLWSSDRSANWWGQDTDIDCGEEDDSFDVVEEVPWHIQVSLMKINQQLVPSRGGGKTKWYGMVSSKGNDSGKFVNESKAVIKYIDKMRSKAGTDDATKKQRRMKQCQIGQMLLISATSSSDGQQCILL
jgi:hypothetical protein